MKLIYDPFEPTPESFHRRVAQKLNELQRTHTPVPRAYRRITVLAACLVLGLVLQPATMHIYNRLKGSMLDRADAVAEACIKVLGVDNETEA